MTENIETLLYNITKAVSLLDMRLCLATLKGFKIVKIDEIIYCEAERNYTVFYIAEGKKLVVSKPLFEYDRILSDATFVRIHKSFLINMSHVKEYVRGDGGTVLMSNNAELEVSRGKKDLFLARIKESFR